MDTTPTTTPTRIEQMLATLWTSEEIRAEYDSQAAENAEWEEEAGQSLDALGNPEPFPSYEEWLVREDATRAERDGRWNHEDAGLYLWWAAIRQEQERLMVEGSDAGQRVIRALQSV